MKIFQKIISDPHQQPKDYQHMIRSLPKCRNQQEEHKNDDLKNKKMQILNVICKIKKYLMMR